MPMKQMKPIDDAVRDQYDKQFDPEWFIENVFGQLKPGEKDNLKKLHDLFTKGKLEGPIKRCIDIGCGPIVHRLSAPSKICDTLVYSDISSNNRKMVQDWVNGPENDQKYMHMFKFCAELEGFDDLEKGAIEIMSRVKSKVKDVKPINVMNPNPIGQLDEPFDFAYTNACIEAACDSFESYVTAIKNVASLIRPGGYFVIRAYLGSTYYVIKGIEFPSIPFDGEMFKKGLEQGGFQIQESDIYEGDVLENVLGGKVSANADGIAFAVARKL